MSALTQRWVVKIGSSLVTREGHGVDREAIDRWSEQIAALRAQAATLPRAGHEHDAGHPHILPEIIIVSSGAIAEGIKRLGLARRPREVSALQAAAAIGQMGIAQAYEASFRQHGIVTAQVLLTHEDLSDRRRYLNARQMLRTMLRMGVVPIVNENDSVTTDEIKVGDNDTLAALVGNLTEADWLVLLTDQSGLYTADPRKDPAAVLLPEVQAGDPALEKMAGGAGSSVGTGGMLTKVLAAKRAAISGTSTIVCSGHEPRVLTRLMSGESIGTRFLAQTASRMAARKKWMADHLQLRGRLIVDDGAARALRTQGSSLLPIGVVGVRGSFMRGELVAVHDLSDNEIARGLCNYGDSDARRLMGRQSTQIESILGFIDEIELIHRDNMVLR